MACIINSKAAQGPAIQNAAKPFSFWTINTPYLDWIQSTKCRGANFNWMRVWRLYTLSHHGWIWQPIKKDQNLHDSSDNRALNNLLNSARDPGLNRSRGKKCFHKVKVQMVFVFASMQYLAPNEQKKISGRSVYNFACLTSVQIMCLYCNRQNFEVLKIGSSQNSKMKQTLKSFNF